MSLIDFYFHFQCLLFSLSFFAFSAFSSTTEKLKPFQADSSALRPTKKNISFQRLPPLQQNYVMLIKSVLKLVKQQHKHSIGIDTVCERHRHQRCWASSETWKKMSVKKSASFTDTFPGWFFDSIRCQASSRARPPPRFSVSISHLQAHESIDFMSHFTPWKASSVYRCYILTSFDFTPGTTFNRWSNLIIFLFTHQQSFCLIEWKWVNERWAVDCTLFRPCHTPLTTTTQRTLFRSRSILISRLDSRWSGFKWLWRVDT